MSQVWLLRHIHEDLIHYVRIFNDLSIRVSFTCISLRTLKNHANKKLKRPKDQDIKEIEMPYRCCRINP